MDAKDVVMRFKDAGIEMELSELNGVIFAGTGAPIEAYIKLLAHEDEVLNNKIEKLFVLVDIDEDNGRDIFKLRNTVEKNLDISFFNIDFIEVIGVCPVVSRWSATIEGKHSDIEKFKRMSKVMGVEHIECS